MGRHLRKGGISVYHLGKWCHIGVGTQEEEQEGRMNTDLNLFIQNISFLYKSLQPSNMNSKYNFQIMCMESKVRMEESVIEHKVKEYGRNIDQQSWRLYNPRGRKNTKRAQYYLKNKNKTRKYFRMRKWSTGSNFGNKKEEFFNRLMRVKSKLTISRVID